MDDEVREVWITWQGSEESWAGDMLNPSSRNQPHLSSRALLSYKWTSLRQQSARTSSKTLKGWAEVTDPGWLMRKDGVFPWHSFKGISQKAQPPQPTVWETHDWQEGERNKKEIFTSAFVNKLLKREGKKTSDIKTEKNRHARKIKREQIIHMTLEGSICW